MRVKILTVLGLVLLLTCTWNVVVTPVASSSPSVLHVGPGYEYETIHEAVEVAEPGDTIIVHSAVYEITKTIVVDKKLNITSDTGDYRTTGVILKGSPGWPGRVFELAAGADGTIIRGFRFENVKVSDTVISSWHVDVGDITIQSNSFININGPAVSRGGVFTRGWRILDNRVHNVTGEKKSGFWLSKLEDVIIKGNEISNTTYAGMILDTIYGIEVSSNIIYNTPKKGVQLANCHNALVKDNYITNTNFEGEPDEGAISIYPDCTNIRVEGNTLTGNYQGFTVRAKGGSVSSDVHVNYNNIYDNRGYGVANFALGGGILDARYNWWGHASGPGGPDGRVNPAGKIVGKGDKVGSNVSWEPWLPQPVGHTPNYPVPPGLSGRP